MEHRGDEQAVFEGLADFESEFFTDLVRSYAKLDLGMRGFFYHRIKQVVRETIELLRAGADPRYPGAEPPCDDEEGNDSGGGATN